MLQVEVPIESSPRYYNEANGADFSPFYKPIRENPVEVSYLNRHNRIANCLFFLQGGLMQHQVLSSTLVPAKTHYFVGVMDKGTSDRIGNNIPVIISAFFASSCRPASFDWHPHNPADATVVWLH